MCSCTECARTRIVRWTSWRATASISCWKSKLFNLSINQYWKAFLSSLIILNGWNMLDLPFMALNSQLCWYAVKQTFLRFTKLVGQQHAEMHYEDAWGPSLDSRSLLANSMLKCIMRMPEDQLNLVICCLIWVIITFILLWLISRSFSRCQLATPWTQATGLPGSIVSISWLRCATVCQLLIDNMRL